MKIVLDTNVLLVSISSRSRYRPIFTAFLNESYTLCVSTEILMEYEEIIGKHMGREVSESVLQLIENAPNVHLVTTYFKWELIEKDPDDNKFVDCAVACNAQYLVSDDRHFGILDSIEFPEVLVLSARKFLEIITP